jgi:hypothetical protein
MELPVIRPHYVPLYQSICHSDKLADLREKDARFFYCCILTHCDSYGRMSARPRTVYARLWALFGKLESVPALLDDLERVGLIVRYEASGEPFLAIPDWEEKAGRVGRPDRRGAETIPAPPVRGSTPAECGSSPAEPVMTEPPCGSSPASRARLDPSQAEPSRAEPSRDARAKRASPSDPFLDSLAGFPSLDTPEVRSSAAEYVLWRKEAGHPTLKARSWVERLRSFEAHGAASLAAALRASVANGWQGVFLPRANGGLPGPLQPKPGGMREWFAQQDAASARTIDVEGGAL